MSKQTVAIPATAARVVTKLDGLGRLITAQEWERAALLASVVRLDFGNGGRNEARSSARLESANEFARRGLHGLRSVNTVSRYVQAWLDTHNGRYPALGATVKLPTIDFPTTERGQNQGPHISADPQVAVQQVIAQHGKAAVTKAVVKQSPRAVVDAIQAAGVHAEDQVFHELQQRRAGIDTSPANRKAAAAAADALIKPFKQMAAATRAETLIGALEAATEDLREVIAEGLFTKRLDARINKALDEFQAVRAEGIFAVS